MDEMDLEQRLDSFSLEERKSAFLALLERARREGSGFPEALPLVNLHFHTFFSFNACGYSPLHILWLAKKRGLRMAGSVDFDVLHALPEFLWGGLTIHLAVSSGLETRIFLPEFREQELSSPNEPGVAYYMGNGFTRLPQEGSQAAAILDKLYGVAQARNQKVLNKVNAYLAPVQVDYEEEVLPLTPSRNPTERHLVVALATKAEEVIPDPERRVLFWSEKLEERPEKIRAICGDRASFYDFIRMKLMKFGGVGYVKQDAGDFPTLEEVNRMIVELQAIPSFSWLYGLSSGERDTAKLFDFCLAHGVETIFFVPDRNWNLPDEEERRVKVEKMYGMVGEAKKRHMPIFVGTELNRYGQKFVDDFDSPYLAPLAPYFLWSASLLWGHVVMESSSQRGYTSPWARENFPDRKARNAFFARLGEKVPPVEEAIQKVGQRSTVALIKEFGG
ncbi:MAG: hypothetical protein ACP5Q4_01760 [Candidatus Caldatribacteriaceae bacterium]